MGVGILLCFGVVIALSLAMDRVVFRPLRTQSAATMLVATFAVAFLLQAVALLIDQRDDTLGEPAASLAKLNLPWTILGTDVRKITVVAIVTAAVCLVALVLFLSRTNIGLQMRAAAMDFQTARLLGVRANRVIGSAVLLSGIIAGVVAVMLTVQQPLVTSTFALRETIVVLAGVVVGGMNRLLSATLGGFAIGYASGLLGGALPTDQSQYLPSFLFGLVILTLLVRPAGLFTRGAWPGGAGVRSPRSFLTVLAPVVLVAATAFVGSLFERSTEIYFINALVAVSIVVALYVFVGNSGVVSFGHIAFVAVGAWTAGVLSVPVEEKPATMPSLYGFLGDTTVGNLPSLLLAALVGGVFALVAGLPLMRLSGLAAGIATFAVLEITNNVLRYYEKIGPGLNVFSSVPETTDMQQAALGAIVVIVVAFAYQVSRFGRQLRAARDDAPGGARGGDLGLRPTPRRVRPVGRAGRLRRRAVRPLPADQRRRRVPRPHLHHPRDARDRRHDEPLGRRGRRARGLRARLAAGGGGERRRRGRPPVRQPDRRRRRPDGDRADPAAAGAHRRPRARARSDPPDTGRRGGRMRVCVVGCGAVGSLFAANLATLDDVEVWAFDLNRVARRCDQKERIATRRRGRGHGSPARDVRRGRAARLRLRDRRDEGDARGRGDRGDRARLLRSGARSRR